MLQVGATGIEEEEEYLLHVSIQLDHHQAIFIKFTTHY
jgi:hypothetical protein